jgi:hypothetical protein
VKVAYRITAQEFRLLYPPYRAQFGRNSRFRAALGFCGILVVWGLIFATGGEDIKTGTAMVAIGVVGIIAAYEFQKQSVERAKAKYEADIQLNYLRAHCRDHREMETDANAGA